MDNLKIEQLAELFRQRESVNAQIAQILAGGGDEVTETPQPARKIKVKKAKANKPAGTNRGRRLTPEEKEEIANDLRAGKSISQVCRDRGVSNNTVWIISKKIKKAKPEAADANVDYERKPEEGEGGFKFDANPAHTYQCYKGHKFQSVLEKSDNPKCPECGQKVFREIQD